MLKITLHHRLLPLHILFAGYVISLAQYSKSNSTSWHQKHLLRGVLENRCYEICSQILLKMTMTTFLFSKVIDYELLFSRTLNRCFCKYQAKSDSCFSFSVFRGIKTYSILRFTLCFLTNKIIRILLKMFEPFHTLEIDII